MKTSDSPLVPMLLRGNETAIKFKQDTILSTLRLQRVQRKIKVK